MFEKIKGSLAHTDFGRKLKPFYWKLTGDIRAKKGNPSKKNILLACLPKSGSTYISNIVSTYPNFIRTDLVVNYGHSEQEIDSNQAVRYRNINYVAQHHIRYSKNTDFYIKNYGMIPIVLTRNFFDTIISIKEHIKAESMVWPMAMVNNYIIKLDDKDLELALAELFGPWLFNFYVSWSSFSNKLHITYEDLVENENILFEKIFRYCGLEDNKIEKCLFDAKSGRKNRLNVGIIGRGESLNSRAKDFLIKISKYYPEIDFTKVL